MMMGGQLGEGGGEDLTNSGSGLWRGWGVGGVSGGGGGGGGI